MASGNDNNDIIVQAWNTVLFDKFLRFKHLLIDGLDFTLRAGEVHALVEEALTRISSTYRTALVLREVEELSYEEIAEILEISLGTVKSRMRLGLLAMRRHLEAGPT